MATKKVIMICEGKEQGFELAHAQRILVWQKQHPTIMQRWELKTEDYKFDDVANELILNSGTGTNRKTEKPKSPSSK